MISKLNCKLKLYNCKLKQHRYHFIPIRPAENREKMRKQDTVRFWWEYGKMGNFMHCVECCKHSGDWSGGGQINNVHSTPVA